MQIGTPQSQPQTNNSSGGSIYDFLQGKATTLDNSVGGSLINQLFGTTAPVTQGANMDGTAGQGGGLATQALRMLPLLMGG